MIANPIKLTPALVNSPNLTGEFAEDDLKAIGRAVKEGYTLDKDSRREWELRCEAAFNLALQLQEAKSFPWPGSSNVKFPLVTIAAIQWHSRAYPLLLQGPDIVKARVVGPDPDGQVRARAQRVSNYMSYQLLEDSPSWEEETDRALLQIPIVGCAFKKTYYSALEGRNNSDLVSAKDLVINYWAKSVETAQRKTHYIPLTRNDVYERVRSGTFRDVLEESWYHNPRQPQTGNPQPDSRTGQRPPSRLDETTPLFALEQHVRLDLDGDGYAEPYVITVEEISGEVLRIIANFEEDGIQWTDPMKPWKSDILRIREDQYFTKYSFIPSPDGGIYDVGFGILLGPINHTVNTLINQLVDAGTLATTAGGFLGRGVKIRGGEYSFRPFGWQRVDSTGEDLHKGIYPFPIREPSNVLFQLLGLLVDYTNRISGATDIMVGENPGQNTPAQTSQLMAEQGSKINSAIFKRVWRGLRAEYQKLYKLNRRHTPVMGMAYGEKSGWISGKDFDGPEEAIRPAADPNLASDGQAVQKAMLVKQQSMTTGGYNKDEVERALLRAAKVESIDTIFPGSDKIPAPPHPKVAIETMKQQGKAASDQSRLKEKAMALMADREKNLAEIELIQAQIAQIVSEIGEAHAASQVKAFEAHLGALKAVDESQRGYLELLQKGTENGNGQGSVPRMGGAPGHPSGQGPAGLPSGGMQGPMGAG
jgi:chaperonin GroES